MNTVRDKIETEMIELGGARNILTHYLKISDRTFTNEVRAINVQLDGYIRTLQHVLEVLHDPDQEVGDTQGKE